MRFGGTNVAVYRNNVLVLTASDLQLTVTQASGTYYDSWYKVEGTFSDGSFTVYMEEVVSQKGSCESTSCM